MRDRAANSGPADRFSSRAYRLLRHPNG